MRTRTAVLATTIGSFALVASVVSAQGASAADPELAVDVITINGTGCPVNTGAVTVSPDTSELEITYSDLFANLGSYYDTTVTQPAMRRNCQVVLGINTPEGYQYSFNRIKLRGYATLQDGVTATISSSVYHQGSAGTETRSKTIAGPYRDSLFFQPIVPADESTIGWSECGTDRYLNINNSVVLQAEDLDEVTRSYAVIEKAYDLQLEWQQC